jgi:hypothetical protein
VHSGEGENATCTADPFDHGILVITIITKLLA